MGLESLRTSIFLIGVVTLVSTAWTGFHVISTTVLIGSFLFWLFSGGQETLYLMYHTLGRDLRY